MVWSAFLNRVLLLYVARNRRVMLFYPMLDSFLDDGVPPILSFLLTPNVTH
jgi:hypothetical protein